MSNKLQDRLIRKASALRLPVMCALELLPVCNLSCKMCYVRKSMAEVRAAGGLKAGQWWLDIARQARELGLVYPLLTGGEPLLHPDFRMILDGMNRLGMQVSINSNGTLIDRDWVRWFTDHRTQSRSIRVPYMAALPRATKTFAATATPSTGPEKGLFC